MALFGTKKDAPAKAVSKAPKAEKKAAAKQSGGEKAIANSALENVLRAPWLSEKALIATEKSVYVFSIPPSATKKDVALAVERLYKVIPVKVTVATLPGKRKNLRTKRGQGERPARRKAYVHLKKGETISFA